MKLGNFCFLGLLLHFNSAVNAANLQRLFTTAEERMTLNQTRANPPKDAVARKAVTETDYETPITIFFNGFLQRSLGPTTVWLNGSNQPVQAGFLAKVEAIEAGILPIVIGKEEVYVKPGQIINTFDKKVEERFLY